jgi:glycosyltransferase involved in cell wall biosynthesis
MNIEKAKNDEQKSVGDMLCSVCIATYRRSQLLEDLLNSLEDQELTDVLNIEIIVVDNDAKKSSESIVDNFRKHSKHEVKYFCQPKKNISLTRNLAVEKASGEYILFIDDDETASEKWVYHLKKTVDKYNADGAFGPVIAKFNKDTPEWMRSNDLFYNPVSATGTKAQFTWTSNCIIYAPLIKKMPEPFDPEYGISGGGDPHLFERLEKQGANFVYCREAIVYEYLPQSRTRISYIFKRNLKGGTSYTRRVIEFAGKDHLKARLSMAIKGIARLILSSVGMALFSFNHFRRTKWMIIFASNLGRIFAVFGYHYKGYR